MKKLKFLLVFLMLLILFPFFSLDNIYASVNIYFNPSSGVIDGRGKSIDIVVDSGGTEINGLEMGIKYSGDIEFVDHDSGTFGNCPDDVVERDETYEEDLFLYCFIMTDPYIGDSGVFATLNFEPTAEGTAELEIINVIGVDSPDVESPVTYTTTLSVQDTDSDPPPTSPLPRTSIFNTLGIVLGVALLFSPLILNNLPFTKARSQMARKVG